MFAWDPVDASRWSVDRAWTFRELIHDWAVDVELVGRLKHCRLFCTSEKTIKFSASFHCKSYIHEFHKVFLNSYPPRNVSFICPNLTQLGMLLVQ